MSNTPEVFWPGKSGQQYGYWVSRIDANYLDEPGNYIFAKVVNGYWVAVYIGQTNSLANRLNNHPKEPCAIRNGATHIHAHTNHQGENARKVEEVDLIENWQPVCNVQHVNIRF